MRSMEQIGFINGCIKKKHTPWGSVKCFGERVLEKDIKVFGLALGDLGHSLKKKGFAPDWLLSGNGGNSVTD